MPFLIYLIIYITYLATISALEALLVNTEKHVAFLPSNILGMNERVKVV
jgi:hypothetical protein